MIAALALVLATAAAQPPARGGEPPLVVRNAAGRADTLAVVAGADGAEHVALVDLARTLDGSLATPARGRVRLRLGTTDYDFGDELPFVAAGDRVYPLGDPARVEGGRALAPLTFVTDVLARAGSGFLFDAARRELRTFSTAARPASTPPARAATVPPERGGERDAAPAPSGGRTRTIVVDAGHGGPDGGMLATLGGGRTIPEKAITLAVARQLGEVLRARGATVVMTRTRDTLIALADRGRIANQRRGELFVSIHVNAANPAWRDAASTRGFETYFLAEAKTEDARRVAELENESVRFETETAASPGDPLGFVITDMAQNEHLRESSELATRIQRRLGRAHPGPSRGVKQAGFRVLVSAFMPAVLVEIGYGSNPAEASYMASPRGQREIAAAIADAALEYLADYDRRVVRGAGR